MVRLAHLPLDKSIQRLFRDYLQLILMPQYIRIKNTFTEISMTWPPYRREEIFGRVYSATARKGL